MSILVPPILDKTRLVIRWDVVRHVLDQLLQRNHPILIHDMVETIPLTVPAIPHLDHYVPLSVIVDDKLIMYHN